MSEEKAEKIEETKEDAKKNIPAPIPVNKRGITAPSDSFELVRTIGHIATGGGFPDCFDTDAKRFAAYNMARSLAGEKFQLALNHMAIIKGKMSIYGELPRTIAEQTKEVEEFHVYAIDKNYKIICTSNNNLNEETFAGVCEVKRKGRKLKEFTYTIDEARNAGQYPAMKNVWENGKKVGEEVNKDSPWMKFTKVMLMRKAQALGVKFEFPDAMIGTTIAEYDHDMAPDLETPMRDVNPETKKKSILNDVYRQEAEETGHVDA